jgi:hypothetical protein
MWGMPARCRILEGVTITTERATLLRPLLGAAMQNEARLAAYGIRRTQERLAAFEELGMSSGVFERRFEARELAETLDFTEWRMEIQALRLLKEQYETLNEARLD